MSHPELRGFFSYVRQVDAHDVGRLSRLRERLQGEIAVQTGMAVQLFQDISELKWGDRWEQKLMTAAAGSMFLIPAVTPGYFLSDSCRKEYEAFRGVEKKHDIQGVILPIYYVDTDELSDPEWRKGSSWAEEIAAMQWADWRTLRLEPWETAEPNKRIEQMAKAFKARLKELGMLRSPLRPASVRAPASAPAENVAGTQAATSGASPDTPEVERLLPRRREVIVDQNGRGHFRTIADAVKAATADDVLMIKPGTYREAVSIEKSLTLVGDGPRQDIVIEADSGRVVSLSAPFGRLVNVTIRRLKAGNLPNFAVAIPAGRFELEGCDITSESLACVGVFGEADPTIRRNRIHDGSTGGVFVYDKARGTVEDNDIFANKAAGIEIRDDADPTVRGNQIHDGAACGVLVHMGGRGTLEANQIFANRYSGIEIAKNAAPIVRRNRIHDCKESGVFVYEKGRGVLEDNDIFKNASDGVAVQEGGNPIVRANRINRNESHGVWVQQNGEGTFEDNDLRDNGKGPWSIATDSQPNVKRSGNTEK